MLFNVWPTYIFLNTLIPPKLIKLPLDIFVESVELLIFVTKFKLAIVSFIMTLLESPFEDNIMFPFSIRNLEEVAPLISKLLLELELI